MNHIVLAVAFASVVVVVDARATDAPAPAAPAASHEEAVARALGPSRSAIVAAHLSEMTGVALSPLAGMAFLGGVEYLRTAPEARATLPLYADPRVFVPLLILTFVMFLGHRIPGLSRAAKAAKLLERKISGFLALLLFVPEFADAVARPLGQALGATGGLVLPVARAADFAQPSAASVGVDVAWVLAAIGGASIMSAVWLLGHAFNVLVLISPFTTLDWIIKGVKAGALGLLVTAAAIEPRLGLFVAVPYIIISFFLASWTFRLMVFGWVIVVDILFCRWRTVPTRPIVRAFAGASVDGVPARTWGWLEACDGGVVFHWRPWLVLPRRSIRWTGVTLAVEDGIVTPTLVHVDPDGNTLTLARMPPRYRTHVALLATHLRGLPTREALPVRGWRAFRGWIAEQLGRARHALHG